MKIWNKYGIKFRRRFSWRFVPLWRLAGRESKRIDGGTRRAYVVEIETTVSGWIAYSHHQSIAIPADATTTPPLVTSHFWHSALGHPLMALAHLFGLNDLGDFIHDEVFAEPDQSPEPAR